MRHQDNSHDVFRRYYFRGFLILMAYLLIVVPIIWLYPNLWSAVFCFVLFLPVKILIRITANKTFASVLFEK